MVEDLKRALAGEWLHTPLGTAQVVARSDFDGDPDNDMLALIIAPRNGPIEIGYATLPMLIFNLERRAWWPAFDELSAAA